jgi:hypothetical protein
MLNRMWSSPACSHAALMTVHQRPTNTGKAAGAEEKRPAAWREDENTPPIPMLLGSEEGIARCTPMTNGTKPMSPPQRGSRREAPEPGIAPSAVVAPVVAHPTSTPQRQITDPLAGA